jgi:hypothetical protein
LQSASRIGLNGHVPDEAHAEEQAQQTPAVTPAATPAAPMTAPASAGPLSVPSAVGNRAFSSWSGGADAQFGTPPPPVAGNRAFASWAGGGAPVARTPASGNAPDSVRRRDRDPESAMLARAVLAREDPAAGASAGPSGTSTDTAVPTGNPVPINIWDFAKDTIVPKEGETKKDLNFPKKTYRVGAGTSGKKGGFHGLDLHRPGAGLSWDLDAEAMASMQGAAGVKLKREKADGDNVKDSVSGYGNVDMWAGAFGRLQAGLKADAIIAGVSAGVSAKLMIRNAYAKARVDGEVSRTGPAAGVDSDFSGSIKYTANIAATLSAAASAYFEWHFLWWGRRYELKIGQFDIGTVKLGIEGEIGVGKPSKFPKITPELIIGEIPKVQAIDKGTAPGGAPTGQKLSTKRMATGSGDDNPGAAPIAAGPDGAFSLAGPQILARAPDDQGQTPGQAGGTPPAGQQQDPNAPAPAQDGAAPVQPGALAQEPKVGGGNLELEHQFEVQSEEGGGGAG